MNLDMVWAEIAVAALAGSAFYGAARAARARGDLLASVLPRAMRRGELETEEDRTMKKDLLAAVARGAAARQARRAAQDEA